MLTVSILATAASLSVSNVDFVTILRRGDVPLEGSGVSLIWIEYEVKRSAGTISKMYLTYVHASAQTIPDPGQACTVLYTSGLVDGTVYGVDHQVVGLVLEDGLIIEELSCQSTGE